MKEAMQMATCSKKNLVYNGDFKNGLDRWSGKNIKLLDDPVSKGDSCILLGNKNTIYNPNNVCTLRQDITGTFENGCAYYLYYNLMHAILLEPSDLFFATVAYRDNKGRILNSTPVYIIPSHTTLRWFEYYSIVPPFPPRTSIISVSFMLRGGMMYIDDIRLASQTIKPVPKKTVENNYDNQIINPDAI